MDGTPPELKLYDWQLDVDEPADEVGVEQTPEQNLLLVPEPEPSVPEVAKAPPGPSQILESMLFVNAEPMTFQRAQAAIRGLSHTNYLEILDSINARYRSQNRPYHLEYQGEECTLKVLPRYAHLRNRLEATNPEVKLNQEAVDVLSIVAYEQPIPLTEIEEFRGKPSSNIVRQLVRLGLIQSQPGKSKGDAVAYKTTPKFLEQFGLETISDLPRFVGTEPQ